MSKIQLCNLHIKLIILILACVKCMIMYALLSKVFLNPKSKEELYLFLMIVMLGPGLEDKVIKLFCAQLI